MSENPFGRPLDPALLAQPPAPAKRPLPAGWLAGLALPAAALAGASLLQRGLEGPRAPGDVLGRWILFACLAGAPLGLLAGFALARTAARRLLWLAWGAASPLVVAMSVLGAVQASHPLREKLAARGEAKCRATRKVCTVAEFDSACRGAGAGPRARARAEERLGAPLQSLCAGGSCTHRWLYTGPWTPDNWVAPGSILCSVVVDAQGNAVRSALGPGPEAP